MSDNFRNSNDQILDAARATLWRALEFNVTRVFKADNYKAFLKDVKGPFPISPEELEVTILRKATVASISDSGLEWEDVFKTHKTDLNALIRQLLSETADRLSDLEEASGKLKKVLTFFFRNEAWEETHGPVFALQFLVYYRGDIEKHQKSSRERLGHLSAGKNELRDESRAAMSRAEKASFFGSARDDAMDELLDCVDSYIRQQKEIGVWELCDDIYTMILETTATLQDELQDRARALKDFYGKYEDLIKNGGPESLLSDDKLLDFFKGHHEEEQDGGPEKLAEALAAAYGWIKEEPLPATGTAEEEKENRLSDDLFALHEPVNPLFCTDLESEIRQTPVAEPDPEFAFLSKKPGQPVMKAAADPVLSRSVLSDADLPSARGNAPSVSEEQRSELWELIGEKIIVSKGRDSYSVCIYPDVIVPRLYDILLDKGRMSENDIKTLLVDIQTQYFKPKDEICFQADGEFVSGFYSNPAAEDLLFEARKQLSLKKKLEVLTGKAIGMLQAGK